MIIIIIKLPVFTVADCIYKKKLYTYIYIYKVAI